MSVDVCNAFTRSLSFAFCMPCPLQLLHRLFEMCTQSPRLQVDLDGDLPHVQCPHAAVLVGHATSSPLGGFGYTSPLGGFGYTSPLGGFG